VLFHAGMVIFAFVMLVRTARLRPLDPLALVGVLALGTVASELRFEARPELLSYCFLVLVLHLLHRRSLGLASPIWLLPLLHLLWVNCHSLFVTGWVAMACFVIGGRIRRGRFDPPLVAWSLGAVAATLINPYGLRGVLFPFTLASRFSAQTPFAQSIGEFVSPFALKLTENFPFYPMTPIYGFRLLALLALPALFVLFHRRHWESLLLIVAVFPLAAGMIRNMPLFVI